MDEAMNSKQNNIAPNDYPLWGSKFKALSVALNRTTMTVYEMTALALGLDRKAFTKISSGNERYLIPGGSNIGRERVGTVFTAYHYDFNLTSIQGRTRYPGLYAWTRDGSRVAVNPPEGCLMIRTGRQFEWLTGGRVWNGFHEVVCTDEAKELARDMRGPKSWRVAMSYFALLD